MPARKASEVELLEESDDDVLMSVITKRQKTDLDVPFSKKASKKNRKGDIVCRFLGNAISKDEAARRWPDRYPAKKDKKKTASSENSVSSEKKKTSSGDNSEQEEKPAICVGHYTKAEVDGTFYQLNDCAYVNAGEGPDYIGRIVEFYKTDDGSLWFTAQWFFRAQDTAIGDSEGKKHDSKRVFYSEIRDDNPLECLEGKLKIIKLSPLQFFDKDQGKTIPKCDYYYDMGYDYAYSRFYTLPSDHESGNDSSSTLSSDSSMQQENGDSAAYQIKLENGVSNKKSEMSLLDLYSGCGGMSTGLCMGANLSGVKLVAKWAVDLNEHACKSLKHNHPETQVRNEAAEDFLALLKEWQKLCEKYANEEEGVVNKARGSSKTSKSAKVEDGGENSESDEEEKEAEEDPALQDGEFEVEKIIGIRCVGPSASNKSGLEFKVHWKGYGASEDSWEPMDGLGGCEESIKKFVIRAKKSALLPLPGDVDVICGGPPCQGASGFNRFRNKEDPLADVRNKQIVVYMDIVKFLRPQYVLMENVVDILKFAGGILGRYALSQLVQMHYQVKLGLMVAGCYGLPQFRMRVFLWGATPTQVLPPYPLPSHDVVQKGGIPQEWERNMVAYDETQQPKLSKALTLGDALSDLPPVENSESRDEMSYGRGARTEFQRYIRLPKEVLTGKTNLASCKKQKMMLYDHRPLQLNVDDYQRTCRIPKTKGANFRNLPGVIVNEDNRVALDTNMERVLLPSGKPLVPDYAITFVKGRSLKPFARLWWDETVPTVVTRAEPHNQAILHPEQDRVLTIRENARLQGFPDYYKLFGPVKERYIQVGNAVAVPVARALGYALGLAAQRTCPEEPVMVLPAKFPHGLGSAAQQMTDALTDAQDSA